MKKVYDVLNANIKIWNLNSDVNTVRKISHGMRHIPTVAIVGPAHRKRKRMMSAVPNLFFLYQHMTLNGLFSHTIQIQKLISSSHPFNSKIPLQSLNVQSKFSTELNGLVTKQTVRFPCKDCPVHNCLYIAWSNKG